jgi:hypothetical protein
MNKLKRIVLSKSFLSLFITLSIVAVLIFTSSPAQALTISVSNAADAYQGIPYTFSITVNIEDSDLLPIQHVDLRIYNTANPDSYTINYPNLPIPAAASSTAVDSVSGSFGTVSASGTSGTNWGYNYGNRYGYGYGYQSQSWGYSNFGSSYGYGYGYGSYIGPTTLTYSITWTPSTDFQTGSYNIRVLVYGNGSSTALTHPGTYSFTLYAAPVVQVPISTGGGASAPEPGVTNVSNIVNSQGVFTQSVIAKSADQNVTLNIPSGTIGKTREGAPLTQISITPMTAPPAPPAQANVIGLTYDLGPEGATFDPPITVSFTYDPTKIPAGINERDLVIAFYNKATGKWENLTNIVVDPVTHTITGKTSHFTAFAVLAIPAATTPAAVTPAPTTPAATTPAAVTTAPTTPAATTPAAVTPAPTTPAVTTPAPTPAPTPTPTNGGRIIILIVAAIVVIALILYFFWWRRRRP